MSASTSSDAAAADAAEEKKKLTMTLQANDGAEIAVEEDVSFQSQLIEKRITDLNIEDADSEALKDPLSMTSVDGGTLGPSGSSTPLFPLLDARFDHVLKLILQKMTPSALATVRESSLTVHRLLMEEACRRRSVAETKFEEFMRPDCSYRKYSLLRTGAPISAWISFIQDKVKVCRVPAPFFATSLLFQQSQCESSSFRQSYDFWKEHIQTITPATAMSHLAGSKIPEVLLYLLDDAERFLDLISPYKISLDCLYVCCCSRTAISQLVSYFHPKELYFESELPDCFREVHEDVLASCPLSPWTHACRATRNKTPFLFRVEQHASPWTTRFQKEKVFMEQNEEVAMEQIDLDKLEEISVSSRLQYPERVLHHFLSRFQEGRTSLRRFCLAFPMSIYPASRPLVPGMTSTTLLERYEYNDGGSNAHTWRALLRSDSSPPRHLLFTGECSIYKGSSFYDLEYLYVSDVEELLREMFHPSSRPDLVYPSVADFSQNQIRDMFKRSN